MPLSASTPSASSAQSASALALRAVAGAALASFTVPALASLPLPVTIAGLGVMALTMWKPAAGLTAAVAIAPARLLLAPPPARVAELVVWSFLAAWLLCLWRPLASTGDSARMSANGNPRTPARESNAALVPALLFALCAAASWLAYIVGGAPGVEPLFVPALVLRAVPLDHLVFSSPEPETFTILPLLAGLALLAAGSIVAREHPASRLAVAAAIVISAAVLSVLTILDVVRQWAAVDYGGWFLLRYVRGERFSLHLSDLNAAGSHYVMGALIAAALATGDRARRAIWAALALLIAPALWISGSRSASVGGLLVGGSLIPLVRREVPVRITPAHRALLLVAAAALVVSGAVIASQPAEQGTASNALRLRAHFLVTSARMFASAPVFGVGIGHYHERSNEFMPPALRQVYGYENAHNYFAQQFAELGVAGGALFVWLVAAVLRPAWRQVRAAPGADVAMLALLAGAGGYLLTCVTGHPLLVPEVAMPFWGAFGVLAGATADAPSPASASRRTIDVRPWAIAATIVMAGANVALQARRYALTDTPPGERGFYSLETTEDGRMFVWMTRHGVYYFGPQAGTVTIPVRAPNFFVDTDPFLVTVEVGGRRAGVYEAVPDRWTTIEIPIRRATTMPFRRIDLRANRSWSPMRDRGAPVDDQPRSVMVGETRWTPAGAR